MDKVARRERSDDVDEACGFVSVSPVASVDSVENPTFAPDRASNDFLRTAVVLISCGRPETLKQIIPLLAHQTHRPEEIIVSAVEPSDVAGISPRDDLKVVYGPRGACRQRNAALRAISSSIDIVVFFDDDFVAHPKWIEGAASCFAECADVDCVTGYVLADGVRTGGIDLREGLEIIDRYAGAHNTYRCDGYSPYGCNMAFRRKALADLAFDERLVLYGWLEDRDFGASVSRRGGKLLKIGASVGVHLGVTRGRMSGIRLGYSQVVNPIYLFRKGNMTRGGLADHLTRNIGMNLVRSFWTEPHIDRRGRLAGNIKGFLDVLRGILKPERAMDLT